MPGPSRGDIWLVDLNPTKGREQSGTRPALVVSVNTFNHGPADLVIVLPITSVEKRIPLHIGIDPPEGGLRARSFVKCEDVRSISKRRLLDRWGSVSAGTMSSVEDRVRILMGLWAAGRIGGQALRRTTIAGWLPRIVQILDQIVIACMNNPVEDHRHPPGKSGKL